MPPDHQAELIRLRERTDSHAQVLAGLQHNFQHLDATLNALNTSIKNLEFAIIGGLEEEGSVGLRQRISAVEFQLRETEKNREKRMALVAGFVSVIVSVVGWVLGIVLAK